MEFHPHRNPELLQKWVQVIRIKDCHPTKNSYICSQHFEKLSFVVRPGKRGHRLHDHAVPTIFPAFPDHLQNVSRGNQQIKEKMLDTEPTIPVPSPSKVANTIDTEHSYSTSEASSIKKVIN